MRQIILLLTTLFISIPTWGQTGYFIPAERFSSGLINDICQDKYGFIWVATEFGLNKYDGYRFTEYIHHPDDSTTISSNVVVSLFCDKDGQLWAGTSKGLDRYDYASNKFVHYAFHDGVKPRVVRICQLRDSRLLVATSGYAGLYVVDGHRAKMFMKDDGNLHFVNNIMEDSKGRLWQCDYGNDFSVMDANGIHNMVSTEGLVVDFVERDNEVLIFCMRGIYRYRNGRLAAADIDMRAMRQSETIIRRVYKDHLGNIYIGTRGDGLFRLAKGSSQLEPVVCSTKGIDVSTAKIWAIMEDRNKNLWLGCQSKGLVMIQHTPPQFQSWSLNYQGNLLGSTINSICKGDDGITWCTVQGNGVYGYNRQGQIVAHPASPTSVEFMFRDRSSRYWIGTDDALYAYNPKTGQSEKKVAFGCDKFNDMTDVGGGVIYISTFSKGFCVYDTKTNKLRNYNSNQKDPKKGWLCNNWVFSMMPDSKGCVWLATSSGVSCYDPATDSFRSHGWHQLLNGVLCFSLCETRQGDILIGTENGIYIYERGKKEAVPFGKNSGLGNLVVGYIVEANNGDIWCSTTRGLWQYQVKTKKFISHVNDNGLIGKEYIYCVGMHTDQDTIYFANNNGITTFRPTDVVGTRRQLPAVCLTEFLLAGRPVSTSTDSNGDWVVRGPVVTSDYYQVSYLDNTFTLEFSLLDYVDPRNVIFEYRIDKGEWIQNPAGQNAIQLSHLQSGVYRLEVRALSSGSYTEVKRMTIRVMPPWYRSTWAYVVYFMALAGALVLVGLLMRRRAHRRMDEEKMQFLINATHDIRSPLTLIMGPLAKLKSLVTDETGKGYIDTIDRNAKRLMLLVNQILDERRIDKNQLQLHCRETNMVDFISGICKLYQYNASQRNITFSFERDKDHVIAWIDRINFDKVINNLLSNAFKYTFDGGEVKVVLRETEKEIQIEIMDNGVGLKDEDTDRLFDRFYQGRNADVLGMQGTGIGLNLCRSITKLHGGEVKAKSLEKGSLFCITLPKGNAHLRPEQIVTDSPACEVLSEGMGEKQQFRAFRILVVDDDPEIADYISGELGNRYKFSHAPNGKEALKILLTDSYDLVISDVMMPEMDGITLLKRIKDNPQISQLPVIMLTSKAEVEYKMEGLKSGADAYIAKPFNMEELHIQIDNLIDNVRRLRGKFSGAVRQEERIENIEVKGNDDALMDRIMRSVNAHMSETDFNVDMLAEDVGISRAQLHRKMKEITGISSGRFLRNLRMEQAARLLREGKINVSQVAGSVGYIDLAHFSTAFKTRFGMSPSEYAEANKQE